MFIPLSKTELVGGDATEDVEELGEEDILGALESPEKDFTIQGNLT